MALRVQSNHIRSEIVSTKEEKKTYSGMGVHCNQFPQPVLQGRLGKMLEDWFPYKFSLGEVCICPCTHSCLPRVPAQMVLKKYQIWPAAFTSEVFLYLCSFHSNLAPHPHHKDETDLGNIRSPSGEGSSSYCLDLPRRRTSHSLSSWSRCTHLRGAFME